MRRAAAVVLLVIFALGCARGDSGGSAAAAGLRVDRFDAQRAWSLVERQLSYGQRPAGSEQLRRLARELRRLLPRGRFEPLAGEPGLRNVVGTVPGRRPGGERRLLQRGPARLARAYVARHPGRTAAMVLLDYVGNHGLRLPRGRSSTPALWARMRAAALAWIVDDHTPFLRAGVPAVDLIDWSYPGHELSDRLDKLSRRSLDAVGETVVELASELRTRR